MSLVVLVLKSLYTYDTKKQWAKFQSWFSFSFLSEMYSFILHGSLSFGNHCRDGQVKQSSCILVAITFAW